MLMLLAILRGRMTGIGSESGRSRGSEESEDESFHFVSKIRLEISSDSRLINCPKLVTEKRYKQLRDYSIRKNAFNENSHFSKD